LNLDFEIINRASDQESSSETPKYRKKNGFEICSQSSGSNLPFKTSINQNLHKSAVFQEQFAILNLLKSAVFQEQFAILNLLKSAVFQD
jgi:hypothetical protein